MANTNNNALDEIIEDVKKLQKVCDNYGFYYDEEHPERCFVVRMALDTSFLEKFTAKQWGVKPKKPVIIQLKFDSQYKQGEEIPSIFIFQSSDYKLNKAVLDDYETDFGVVQWFLETRLTKILRKNWDIRSKFFKPAMQVNLGREVLKRSGSKTLEAQTNNNNNGKAENKVPVAVLINEIKSMGFSEDQAKQALTLCNDNIEQALNYLLTGEAPKKPEVQNENKNAQQNNNKRKIMDEDSDDDKTPMSEKTKEIVGMGFKRKHAERALQRCDNDVKKSVEWLLTDPKDIDAPPPAKKVKQEVQQLMDLGFTEDQATFALEANSNNVVQASEYLFENADTIAQKKTDNKNNNNTPKKDQPKKDDNEVTEAENFWLGDQGFLAKLYSYMNLRFITCPQYCLICDKDLDLVTSYKLPVCSSEECIKAYNSPSCGGGSVINEIHSQPEVVDLLLNLLATAASGVNTRGFNRNGIGLDVNRDPNNFMMWGYQQQQQKQTFEPFPHNMGFNRKNGDQDIDLLMETLDSIPSVKEMQKCASDEQLKVLLDDISPLCFPLLSWVIKSNRAHLTLIPAEKQIKEMGTNLQFQVVNSFPEHEKKFHQWQERARRETKNKKGSYFAFHGSSITNWHSIIRTGLRSGFVPGIYMAQEAATSYGYMQVGQNKATGWANTAWKLSDKISCISLIEVADMRHRQDLITGGVITSGVNVAMDHSLVVTRFLFFYPTGPKDQYFGYNSPQKRGGRNQWNWQVSYGPKASDIKVENFMFLKSKDDDDQ